MGRNVTDRQRRVDEVAYFLIDQPAPNVRYEGRTDVFGAPTADPVWQIKRILQIGDVREVTFAENGKYNTVWDNRVSYFPAPPAPPGDPIQVQEVDIYPGDGVFFDFEGTPTTGSEVTVITAPVPADKTRYLHLLEVDCRMESRVVVYAGGIKVGSLRTGPALPFAQYRWTPGRNIPPTTLIEVKITIRLGAPLTDVGVYLQASDA